MEAVENWSQHYLFHTFIFIILGQFLEVRFPLVHNRPKIRGVLIYDFSFFFLTHENTSN